MKFNKKIKVVLSLMAVILFTGCSSSELVEQEEYPIKSDGIYKINHSNFHNISGNNYLFNGTIIMLNDTANNVANNYYVVTKLCNNNYLVVYKNGTYEELTELEINSCNDAKICVYMSYYFSNNCGVSSK